MNLFYLRYFVTLAHVQHYTKAAAQLCISQPNLSHAIAQLEQELGVPSLKKAGEIQHSPVLAKNSLTAQNTHYLLWMPEWNLSDAVHGAKG
ncbi:LysR family transcriptional regulator [Sellimonas catena]|uniref:LysR family transcriptional regulator n=1 Tax=Sellimonas catena TaxID=2994035 RepID=UPI00386A2EE8